MPEAATHVVGWSVETQIDHLLLFSHINQLELFLTILPHYYNTYHIFIFTASLSPPFDVHCITDFSSPQETKHWLLISVSLHRM